MQTNEQREKLGRSMSELFQENNIKGFSGVVAVPAIDGPDDFVLLGGYVPDCPKTTISVLETFGKVLRSAHGAATTEDRVKSLNEMALYRLDIMLTRDEMTAFTFLATIMANDPTGLAVPERRSAFAKVSACLSYYLDPAEMAEMVTEIMAMQQVMSADSADLTLYKTGRNGIADQYSAALERLKGGK